MEYLTLETSLVHIQIPIMYITHQELGLWEDILIQKLINGMEKMQILLQNLMIFHGA